MVFAVVAVAEAVLALTPPMGWMSWQQFRCETDCAKHPDACINEALYRGQGDAMVAGGYLAAGYTGVHIDDCWAEGKRDAQNRMVPDATRFPSGMKALADYLHARRLTFGIYSDCGTNTCAGYPGSYGYETIDANTFASWDVDYLKYDGCYQDDANYSHAYHAMGDALAACGRPISYSCSWPAYLGGNETAKPFASMISAHCQLWRNWDDIQDSWSSLVSIINHWGEYRSALIPWAGPGHWHDPDMLLAGTPGVTVAEAGTQLAIWSISAAPLIMGNDVRVVPAAHRALLLNSDMIAIDQDPLGQMGGRLTPAGDTEVWARPLTGGVVAAALFNKNAGVCSAVAGARQRVVTCAAAEFRSFDRTMSPQRACCEDATCAAVVGGRLYKAAERCEGEADAVEVEADFVVASRRYQSASVTIRFSDVRLPANVTVYDVWAQRSLGVYQFFYTTVVPPHGTAFVRLTAA